MHERSLISSFLLGVRLMNPRGPIEWDSRPAKDISFLSSIMADHREDFYYFRIDVEAIELMTSDGVSIFLL